MVLAVAVGQPLALVLRPALAVAEVADRVDEVALLVGQGEVHGAEPIGPIRLAEQLFDEEAGGGVQAAAKGALGHLEDLVGAI